MRKIKLSQIKSPNIKSIFRVSAIERVRTFRRLKNTLTNDEIIEAVELLKEEWHRDKRTMINELIRSQTNFNKKSFETALGELFTVEGLNHLLFNTPREELTEEHISRWLEYALTVAAFDYTKKLLTTNDFNEYLTITEAPYNYFWLMRMIHHREVSFLNYSDILNSLTKDQAIDLQARIVRGSISRIEDLISAWDNVPEELISFLFKVRKELKNILKHKNAPLDLKLNMYETTQDVSFLPVNAKDTFLF